MTRRRGSRLRNGQRRASFLVGVVGLSSLVLTGCGGTEEPTVEPDASPSSVSRGTVLDEGFWRDEALPDPVAETILTLPAPEGDDELATAKLQILSLDSDGEFVRLVMAWLAPDEGIPLGSIVLSSHKHRYEATPFIRLVDRDAGELIEPLRAESNFFSVDEPPQITSVTDEEETTADLAGQDSESDEPQPSQNGIDSEVPDRGTCICSMLSGAADDPPSRTELIYVDFPAPESESVDIVPGEWAEPIPDVEVSSGETFARPNQDSSWFFTHASGEDPPEQYGAGARYEVRYPIAARTETLSGVTTTIEEETQEVSLPSDVLFEFGSADLMDEAADIIESAAEKLNEEAAGFTVTVEGHTDNVGSAELNEELSEERSQAVADVIEEHLDDTIELEIVGYGFTRPQVPNLDADGEPIPENQERNRRVSFRYPIVVQEAGIEVDLGQAGVPELPDALSIDPAEGAQASFIVEPPEDDTSETPIRFDVLDAERTGELVTMRFALAAPPGHRESGRVFTGNPEIGGKQHFGHNPQGDGTSPGLSNMSLIDIGAERRYFPLGSGDMGCLCTEVAGTVETLPMAQSPLYAQFHLSEELEGPVVLHLPDAGQLPLPQDVSDHITMTDDASAEDQ
ncbi:OmpA family protein [Nesterenkonia muleiensis]|uniref:OmpA family protein n=1 Tax=Nesterenkonia muleiensis TaxID=2282648 RepID=UPI001EE3E4CC|nr:OmpA family protein [Nesterenkonia muleiensis]